MKAGHSKRIFLICDALSTTRDLVNSSGSVVASYEFSEYGQRIASSESGVSTQKTWVGGLSVQDEVADTGLMMMGHRFYDPSGGGRFVSRDPIGFSGSLNLFEHAAGRPNQLTDPSGLVPVFLAPAIPYVIAAAEGAIASVAIGMGIRYFMGEDPTDAGAMATDAALGGAFSAAFTFGKVAYLGATAAGRQAGIELMDDSVRLVAAEAGQSLKAGATAAAGSFGGAEVLAASGQKSIQGLASACSGLGSTILSAARNSANPGIYDAERKILEYFAGRISRFAMGSLNIMISKASCPTCIQAAGQFSLRFPGVTTTMMFPGGGLFFNSMVNNLALGGAMGLNNFIPEPPVHP